ncbi:MAG: PilZ domain-containing protein [Aeromonadaceae bacterium]|nr:PilZ domain-containing protein [Aeromonadaceae bacterium]
MVDRRRFFRVVFSTPALLSQGEQQWPTRLLDLSLQGALVERPLDWPVEASGRYELKFCLADSEIELRMEVEPTHADPSRLGLYCHHIDIDSASHLKRLIELNVGSGELLQRELAHLLEEHLEHEAAQGPKD